MGKELAPTQVLIALDASGSMSLRAYDVREGLNQYLIGLAADKLNEYRVSLYLFNCAVTCMYSNQPLLGDDGSINNAVFLSEDNYVPSKSTALYDAIGDVITEQLGHERPLVVVYTDGHENSSREWTMRSLAPLVAAKKDAGWGFVFLGAGIDVWEGERLGMFSGQTVDTSEGTKGMFSGLMMGTAAYARGGSARSVTESATKRSIEEEKKGNNG